MRRADREIIGLEAVCDILDNCDACRIALNTDGGFPYMIPLNFGYEISSGTLRLYFHGAAEGKKHGLIAADARACFEADCSHRLCIDCEKGSCTMEYRSVIGTGMIDCLTRTEDKFHAAEVIMKHYGRENIPIRRELLEKTAFFSLTLSEFTAKAHILKK